MLLILLFTVVETTFVNTDTTCSIEITWRKTWGIIVLRFCASLSVCGSLGCRFMESDNSCVCMQYQHYASISSFEKSTGGTRHDCTHVQMFDNYNHSFEQENQFTKYKAVSLVLIAQWLVIALSTIREAHAINWFNRHGKSKQNVFRHCLNRRSR